jgi:hypothetical protein
MPTASPAPSPWPAPSAGQALFFGRVVDAAGSPIAGVTVSIGPPRVSALTDVAGRYELRGITVGAAGCVWMTLEMRKDGYGSLTTIDNAIEARAYAGDFQLRPGDRRHYIGPPRVELGRYPDVSRYCPAGEWIAPRVPEDTSG